MSSNLSDWRKLRSGSDIRGNADQLTDDFAERIGYVFAQWVARKFGTTSDKIKLAVGHDSRHSGPRLKEALIRGMKAADCDVLDCGMCTTPAMFMVCVEESTRANGSIMITASHHPSEKNGFKFITRDGGLDSASVQELIEAAAVAEIPDPLVKEVDFLSTYTASLGDMVRRRLNDASLKPLLGLHVVVDAGNGAGGFYARFLEDLGAEIEGSQFLDPDGSFPNHIPNPEDAAAMESLSRAVLQNRADLGVIFMDSGGYLNMCGHGSIGVCSMAVDTGMVKVEEPFTHVTLDTPSGLIQAKVKVENGIAKEVTIENVPAFLYLENQSVTLNDGRTVPFDVSFGGSFFALIDADRLGIPLDLPHAGELSQTGMEMLEKINASVSVSHPTLDIRSVDLVEFYSHHASDNADMRNCVVFGDAQVDRSPCGTGTSAKLAALVAKGELGFYETFRYESITGSLFRGEAVREAQVGPYQGVIPHITGSAYLTGFSQWLLRDDDPLNLGFLL